MTHIVYHYNRMVADRKCYRDTGEVLERTKVHRKVFKDKTYIYGFAGGFAECLWGEKVVESNFDPEVIDQAHRALPDTSEEVFAGLLVEIDNATRAKKVFFVNYFGLKFDVEDTGEPIIVGAMSDVILGGYKVSMRSRNPLNITEIIRVVTHNTQFDQTGYEFDEIEVE